MRTDHVTAKFCEADHNADYRELRVAAAQAHYDAIGGWRAARLTHSPALTAQYVAVRAVDWERCYQLSLDGVGYRRIAEMVGVSSATVWHRLRSMGRKLQYRRRDVAA